MAAGKFAKSLIELAEKAGLDMSESARMARAREMGFNKPTLYHGTSTFKTDGDLFEEFQRFEGEDMTRSVSRSPVGKLGISLAEQPGIGGDFARQASPNDGAGAAIVPVKFRHNKIASINLEGNETNYEIYGAVIDAWKQGFDAIQFKNYTTPAGTKGSFVLVKEPEQIRSVNAAFDPAKKDSSNLLAGAAPITVGAGAALSGLSPQNAQASTGIAEAPIHPTAAKMADYAGQYNRARKEMLAPGLDMVLPVSELPENYLNKIAYGDKISFKDRLLAAIGMLL